MRKYLLILLFAMISAPRLLGGHRILFVGDSITKGDGSSDGYGFKKLVSDSLISLGYDFTLVGSSGWDSYKGHFLEGARIDAFYPDTMPGGSGSFDVGFDMNTFRPDIVVIHLGTNDAWIQDLEPGPYRDPLTFGLTTTMSGRLAHLISYLNEWANGSRGDHLKHIFVCQIIPSRSLHQYHPGKVELYNTQVAAMVSEAEQDLLSTIPPGLLTLVDQYSTFDMATMLTDDNTHPNDSGYANMAHVFYTAFQTLPLFIDHQSSIMAYGKAGFPLDSPLSVMVMDNFGDGKANADVVFEVTAGDAQVIGSPWTVTDSLGVASGMILLGQADTSYVRATAPGLIDSTVAFIAVASAYARISGSVTYTNSSQPVPGVEMVWQEGSSAVDTTDMNGEYDCRVIPYGEDVTLVPSKNDWSDVPPNTILSYDAALIARHVVGTEALDANQMGAADCDGDGKISINDAAILARSVVGLSCPPGCRIGGWKFSPGSYYYPSLSSDYTGQHITASVIGDLHGGWTSQAAGRTAGEILIWKENGDHTAISIGFQDEDIVACDLILSFDPSHLVVKDISLEGRQVAGANVKQSGPGEWRIGVFDTGSLEAGAPVLTFSFETVSQQPCSIIFRDIFVNDRRLADRPVNLGQPDGFPKTLNLYHNYPNPFNQETVIEYSLPDESRVQLIIYNQNGQAVRCLTDEVQRSGRHTVRWDGRDSIGRSLPSGLYVVKLQTEKLKKTGKMEILR